MCTPKCWLVPFNLPKRFLGTNCLVCHIIVKGPENRILRTFSVTPDHDGGGTPMTFADMVGCGFYTTAIVLSDM